MDRIDGTPELEGSALLERFGFEAYPGAGHAIQSPGGKERCPVSKLPYPFLCRGKLFPAYHCTLLALILPHILLRLDFWINGGAVIAVNQYIVLKIYLDNYSE